MVPAQIQSSMVLVVPTSSTLLHTSSLSSSLSKTLVKLPPYRNHHTIKPLKCSVSVASAAASAPPTCLELVVKPKPAEVARTIMELSTAGTLSTLTSDGSPIAIGVQFAVDHQDGTPVLCFSNKHLPFLPNTMSSFHVQLEQSGGVRTPQCTIQGNLHKPEELLLKKLQNIWERKFGEAPKEEFIYVVSIEKVIQMEDFMEEGTWVTSSDYKAASPDPLRDFAERIVDEINTNHREDVLRFCNIYVDMHHLPVTEAKLVWVDRLGFDMRVRSVENDTYEVRIPFRREVTDEKGVKSSFNSMSQIAWEVEKNYYTPDFDKVTHLKKISS